ncbi:uncharacterized protein LOC113279593 [Papaver somniferum]|uniref:uncharacterized protein LOC113279593 n=1 Tax=Papaver somniferum TaxID=3469 RepID=UPI000E6F492A|nr:uncharacterized protein LOC113279593 [Papaver somniferum]
MAHQRAKVKGGQFSILVNGGTTSRIQPSKGIRQGDPLSHFLFFFSVVEVLSIMINDAVATWRLTGFQMVEGGSYVSHLQFKDDTIIFLNALLMFEVLTGMNLNLEKSSMTSIGADDVVHELALELGCKVDALHVTYLGIPIGASKRNMNIWDEVIQKLQKQLAPWKRKFLNKAGRVTLIKSSLESICSLLLVSVLLDGFC